MKLVQRIQLEQYIPMFDGLSDTQRLQSSSGYEDFTTLDSYYEVYPVNRKAEVQTFFLSWKPSVLGPPLCEGSGSHVFQAAQKISS